MPVILAGLTFDESHTKVRENYEEVGGRDEREIVVRGLIVGENTVAAIEARLQAILDAASSADFSAELNLRTGRRLFVRRSTYRSEVDADSLVGSFTLELGAKDPVEESTSETSVPWTITASGQTLVESSGGNRETLARITLVATGSIVAPLFSDGTRTLAYTGTIANGKTYEIDGVAGTVTADGLDVTPYTTGEFPVISPEGTTLTYTDDAGSSHTAGVTLAYRDRWW